MDQAFHAEMEGNAFDSKKISSEIEKSSILSPTAQKLGVAGLQIPSMKFASQTPKKTNKPLHPKYDIAEVEVPERYAHLVKLFDGMICSLKLLDLRKKCPTFENIATQVELLTKRKFSCGQLAQMKHILPEAIQIESIPVHDKQTLCMKRNMKISLLFDVIEEHQEHSNFVALHKAFASRLINYCTVNPEGCDIPEASLPDPFDQSVDKAGAIEDNASHLEVSSSVESLLTAVQREPSLKSSHLNPSFARRFSQKVPFAEDKSSQPSESSPSLSNTISKDRAEENSEFRGQSSKSNYDAVLDVRGQLANKSSLMDSKCSFAELLPCEFDNPQSYTDFSACDSPSSKLSSPPNSFTVETPAPSIPRRAPNSEDNKCVAASQKQAASCNQSVKRSLDFVSCSKVDRQSIGFKQNDSACSEFLHCGIIPFEESSTEPQLETVKSQGVPTEVQGMSQPNQTHQWSATILLEAVSLVHSLFRSNKFSPITKEELVYKMLISSFHFVEKREVDEQIGVLEKLISDWIFIKPTPSGDYLYHINKFMDLDAVCERIISR